MLLCRMPIVKAGRGWRQGVRTYVAWEQEINVDSAPPAFKVRVSAPGIWGQASGQLRAAAWHQVPRDGLSAISQAGGPVSC